MRPRGTRQSQWDRIFKAKALLLEEYSEKGRSILDVARDLGIIQKTCHTWIIRNGIAYY